jgi:hypothetical protein
MYYKLADSYNTDGIQNNYNIRVCLILRQATFLLKDSDVQIQYAASSFPSILFFWGNADIGMWVPCHILVSGGATNFFGVSKHFHSLHT